VKSFRKVPTWLRLCFGFAVAGAAIAIALLAYDYLYLTGPDNINRATAQNAELFIILCPSSIVLMGLERAGLMQLLLAFVFIVLGNAGLYGLVGGLFGAIADMFRRSAR
jgi:hypothetical protein